MNRIRWTSGLALVTVVALAGGCETGTEPEPRESFDPQAALQDYQALDDVLSSNVLQDFQVMGANISLETFAPEVKLALTVANELPALGVGGELPALAVGGELPALTEGATGSRLAALAADLDPTRLANPIISAFRRGKTFVYDAALGRYVMDEDLEGAPDTGVRFILYQAGQGGRPDPAHVIGYADLIDEGDESAEEVALRLVVVKQEEDSEVEIINYATTVDFMANGGRITAAGFLQGPLNRLDFDLYMQASGPPGGSTLDIGFEMGLPDRDFLVVGSAQGVEEEEGAGGQVELTIQHPVHRFDVELATTETSIEGTLQLDGKLYATVTGDPDSPTFAGASGDPLTLGERLVVGKVIVQSHVAFGLFELLLQPVDELVIIALIL